MDLNFIYRFFELYYILAEKQWTNPTYSSSLNFCTFLDTQDNLRCWVKEIEGRNPSVKPCLMMMLEWVTWTNLIVPCSLPALHQAHFVLVRSSTRFLNTIENLQTLFRIW